MNRIRKLISLLLVVLMLIPTTVFAADSDRDMFCCRTEIVEIDNTSYTVNYEYDKSGTKTIEMVDNVTGNVDEFVYVENTGKMYLNGELIATVYKKNTATHGLAGAGNVNAFKLRFCNYMLGYRNDDRDQLISMARDISEYYKRMRMYDMARTFDSYRDVLLFGNETISESWDDTMDLLETFQAEIERRKREEACRLERERKKAQPSFWSRLFGGSKEKNDANGAKVDPNVCNCGWEDSTMQAGDQVAIPRVISEPPGSCSPKNPLMFKRTPQYEACFGTGGAQAGQVPIRR